MRGICLVCNLAMIRAFEQPGDIYVLLQYVLGYEPDKEDQICHECYKDLKTAFNFKKRFHLSRHLELQRLRKNRSIVELDHDYVKRTQKISSSSMIPKIQEVNSQTNSEEDFKILTVTDEASGEKYIIRNLSYLGSESNAEESLEVDQTFKDKSETQYGEGNHKNKNNTNYPGNDDCPSNVSKANSVVKNRLEEDLEEEGKHDNKNNANYPGNDDCPSNASKVNSEVKNRLEEDLEEDQFINIEYLKNNEDFDEKTEEVYRIVEVLRPTKSPSGVDTLKKVKYKENMIQLEDICESKTCDLTYKKHCFYRKYRLEDRSIKGVFLKLETSHCEFCFKKFDNLKMLQDHKIEHNEEERPYRCPDPDCKDRFMYRPSVNRHSIIHKRKIKRYECKFCDKKFLEINNLKDHERFHINKMPWKCSDCEKIFESEEELENHDCKLPNYDCQDCYKKCRTEIGLKMHMRIHLQRFECHICGKSLVSLTNLTTHMKIHNGIKSFKCKVCNAAFVTSKGLIQHWRNFSHFVPIAENGSNGLSNN